MAYNIQMVIIETTVFTRLIRDLMDDDTYRELQKVLIQKPDAGDLMTGVVDLGKFAGNRRER
jgi:hypothetical protein